MFWRVLSIQKLRSSGCTNWKSRFESSRGLNRLDSSLVVPREPSQPTVYRPPSHGTSCWKPIVVRKPSSVRILPPPVRKFPGGLVLLVLANDDNRFGVYADFAPASA